MIARTLLLVFLSPVLAGCDDHSMAQQNRYETYAPAGLFPDNAEAQMLPAGVIAQGDLQRTAEVRQRPNVDAALMARGHERFDIFCSPCHGVTGAGDGMIVQRGFPAPPSYHSDRLRAASAQHIFDVITDGYGVMYPYGSRVEPRDRWAIIAYIRALQQSQQARLADAPDLRSKLP
jgi:mono/diheme cytochrome c family protein